MTGNAMRELALEYAANKWPVFPCATGIEHDRETGELREEKSPLISNGLKGATINARIIERLWRDNPAAAVGVPTGETIGAWVLDIDTHPGKPDGRLWLADMEAEHGPLPDTRQATTGGGGRHYFFTHVAGIRNRATLGPGIDTRGDGGYIVAPGSTVAGGLYSWDNDNAILPAPDWLVALALPAPEKERPARQSDYAYGGDTATHENPHYVNSAMRDELEKLAHTAPGSRGSQLNASAYSLGQLVAAGAVAESDAVSELYSAAVACGIAEKDGDKETYRKIQRGMAAGKRTPRDIPAPETDNTRLVDITKMIANGLAKGASKRQAAEPAAEPDTEPEQEPDDLPIHATQFQWLDPQTIPRREWVYGNHYIRRYVSVTSSPGGLGKTSLSIVEALSMVTGRALLGVKPVKKMRVWLYNAEDPRDELERRIMAACLQYKISAEDIGGRLYLDTGREQELVVAIDNNKGVVIQAPIVEAVVGEMKRYGIDVMIIDPFVSTHRVNENDNGAIDAVAKLWGKVAEETNTAIDIVHHVKKTGDREATVDDSRGAGSLLAAARSARILNRMSESQSGAAGLANPGDRHALFSVTYGKSSMSPPSAKLEWRKLVSQPLGNGGIKCGPGGKGGKLSAAQDHVGVVIEWHWPDKSQVAADVPADTLADILTNLKDGDYKYSPQAKDWAGHGVAAVLNVDPADPVHKKKIRWLLDAWINEGLLKKSTRRCEVRRELKTFVDVA